MSKRASDYKCPLSLASDGEMLEPCMKEYCGWWDEDEECCAVVSLARFGLATLRKWGERE